MQGVKYPQTILAETADGVSPTTLHKGKATKAGLKKAVALRPDRVILVATSVFGNEYGGRLSDAPTGTYTVVGPDAYTARDWFANIVVSCQGTERHYVVK